MAASTDTEMEFGQIPEPGPSNTVTQLEAYRLNLATLQERLRVAKQAIRDTILEEQKDLRAIRQRMKRSKDDLTSVIEYGNEQAILENVAYMKARAKVRLAPLRKKIRLLQLLIKAYPDG